MSVHHWYLCSSISHKNITKWNTKKFSDYLSRLLRSHFFTMSLFLNKDYKTYTWLLNELLWVQAEIHFENWNLDVQALFTAISTIWTVVYSIWQTCWSWMFPECKQQMHWQYCWGTWNSHTWLWIKNMKPCAKGPENILPVTWILLNPRTNLAETVVTFVSWKYREKLKNQWENSPHTVAVAYTLEPALALHLLTKAFLSLASSICSQPQ